MKLNLHLGLATFLSLSLLSSLPAATNTALVDLLVQNGVLSTEQANTLERSEEAPVDPALLGLLVTNGTITQAEADGLQATPITAPVMVAAQPIQPAQPVAAPSVVVKAKEKAIESITITGRVHGQMDYLMTDYDNASSPDDELNLFLRRLYLGASAQLAKGVKADVIANFGIDFDGSSANNIEKGIVTIDVAQNHSLQVGYQKSPFVYEETTSSSKIPAVERSISTRYFTEQLNYGARHAGITFNGDYDSGVSFSLAVTNPRQSRAAARSVTDELAFWGRTSWSGELSGAKVEVGINGGVIPEQRVNGVTDYVYGAYTTVSFESLRVHLEYLSGILDAAAVGGDANPQGLTLTGMYKLNKSLELVGRVAYFDADGGVGADISTTFRRAPENGSALFDKAEAYYVGVNWFIIGNNLKLSAGYEFAEFSDNLTGSQGDASSSGFRSRLQFLF